MIDLIDREGSAAALKILVDHIIIRHHRDVLRVLGLDTGNDVHTGRSEGHYAVTVITGVRRISGCVQRTDNDCIRIIGHKPVYVRKTVQICTAVTGAKYRNNPVLTKLRYRCIERLAGLCKFP